MSSQSRTHLASYTSALPSLSRCCMHIPFVLYRQLPLATPRPQIFQFTLYETCSLSCFIISSLFCFVSILFFLFICTSVYHFSWFSYILYLLCFVFPQSEYQLCSSASLSCGLTLLCKFWTRRAT